MPNAIESIIEKIQYLCFKGDKILSPDPSGCEFEGKEYLDNKERALNDIYGTLKFIPPPSDRVLFELRVIRFLIMREMGYYYYASADYSKISLRKLETNFQNQKMFQKFVDEVTNSDYLDKPFRLKYWLAKMAIILIYDIFNLDSRNVL